MLLLLLLVTFAQCGNFEYSCCSTHGIWNSPTDYSVQALCSTTTNCPATHWAQSSFTLNTWVTNNNGVLTPSCSGGFVNSCDHNAIQIVPSTSGCGSWLCAWCLNVAQQWTWSCVFLNSYLSNYNGLVEPDAPYGCGNSVWGCSQLACSRPYCPLGSIGNQTIMPPFDVETLKELQSKKWTKNESLQETKK